MAKTPNHLAMQGAALIPMKDIKANKKWNARMHIEGIEELAKDIKERGLISPITIRAVSEKKYEVVIGFRRYYAMQLNQTTEIPATLFTGDEQAALLLNLSENTQRRDLTTYEIAMRCSLLRDEPHNMPSVAIATTLGKSKTYVENLIRCLKQLADPILKGWSDPTNAAFSLCSTNELNRLAAMEPEMQLAAWDELRGHTPQEPAIIDPTKDPEIKPKAVKRPGKTKLVEAMEVVKLSEDLDESEKAAMVAVLRWALGQVQSLRKGSLVIFNPSRKATEETESED